MFPRETRDGRRKRRRTRVGAVLEYGRASLRTPLSWRTKRLMDIDDGADLKLAQASPATSEADETVTATSTEYPTPFKLVAQLVFAMLEHPTRKASSFARSTLNPYVTIVPTFLTTLAKNPQHLRFSNGQFLGKSLPSSSPPSLAT
jgi:hypothetical protein